MALFYDPNRLSMVKVDVKLVWSDLLMWKWMQKGFEAKRTNHNWNFVNRTIYMQMVVRNIDLKWLNSSFTFYCVDACLVITTSQKNQKSKTEYLSILRKRTFQYFVRFPIFFQMLIDKVVMFSTHFIPFYMLNTMQTSPIWKATYCKK
jgi:hypothetical protein